MPVGHRPAPPSGVARVAIQGTIMGHPTASVFWARITDNGTKTQNDLNSIVTAIQTAWWTRFGALVASTYNGSLTKAVWMTGVASELSAQIATASGGSGGTALQDASGSYLLNWSIGAYYRGGHPRTYLPGVLAGDITNGSTVVGSKVTSLAAAALGFKNDVGALTATNVTKVELGTVSFASAKAWRTPPIFFPYLSGSASNLIATQRRRIGR